MIPPLQTLQMTGITYNVILIRSSTSRDRQFTMFDHNERTTTTFLAAEQRTGVTTTGSIRVISRQNELEDVESNIRSDRTVDEESLRTEVAIYVGGHGNEIAKNLNVV